MNSNTAVECSFMAPGLGPWRPDMAPCAYGLCTYPRPFLALDLHLLLCQLLCEWAGL